MAGGESVAQAPLTETLVDALEQNGWLRTTNRTDTAVLSTVQRCWLRWLVESNDRSCCLKLGDKRYELSREGLRQIESLVADGIQLTCHFRPWQAGINAWIGTRLFLTHASQLSASVHCTSVVSSRVGRGQRHLPDWPLQVDSALVSCQALKHRVLLVPGTALYPFIRMAVQAAGTASVEVHLPDTKSAGRDRTQDWLSKQLVDSEIHDKLSRQIVVSPALTESKPVQTADLDPVRELPLRDRVAIGLADRVIGLSARPRGTIDALLRGRASDRRFPEASTYTAISRSNKTSKLGRDTARSLLASGVVGWIVRENPEKLVGAGLSHCGQRPALVQFSTPLRGNMKVVPEEGWQFLSHCTRGASGPRPLESTDEHRRRIWIEGVKMPHPLITLSEILKAGAIRCSDALNRDTEPVVSFSAVPIQQLLSRRKFQPHLGRWDWEPYGVMIRGQALSDLGAQPVVYGDSDTYDSLSSDQRAYFQPKKRRGKAADWEEEREWRVVGDVRLTDLARQDVLVFVATESQANSLARISRWPVIWMWEPATRGR